MLKFENHEQAATDELTSSSWWVIGHKGVVLGCGNLGNTWLPNKTVLYRLTFMQFKLESEWYEAEAIDFKNQDDEIININSIVTTKSMEEQAKKSYEQFYRKKSAKKHKKKNSKKNK